ncbi:MAG: hypothetical protein Q8Q09_03225 [Deltaproteobacteria bacterium]|nr:hypothetical protein [Deltaproteobacteria bacterium]
MKWLDIFAKGLADAAQAPDCEVLIDESVSLETLVADLVVDPLGASPGLRERGLLGRMAIGPCVIEPCSRAPTQWAVDRCIARGGAAGEPQDRANPLGDLTRAGGRDDAPRGAPCDIAVGRGRVSLGQRQGPAGGGV